MQLDNDTMSEAGSLVSDMFDSHHRSFSASSKLKKPREIAALRDTYSN